MFNVFKNKIKLLSLVLVFSLLFIVNNSLIGAQTPEPEKNSNLEAIQKQIDETEKKIGELQAEQKTLSSQIGVIDNQIKLTELRIDSTETQITDLTLDIDTADKKIGNLESSLDELSKILINRIKATYMIGSISPFHLLLSSSGVGDFMTRANYLRIAQANDKRLIYDTAQAKNDYENQRKIFEDKKAEIARLKKELVGYTAQLDVDKGGKQEVLAVTENDERRYQEILARAQAEYASIVGIIAGKGTETKVRKVNQGDTIATQISGASCNSSGTHLHFTISRDGVTQNPLSYLKSIDHINESNGDPFNPSGNWEWPIDSPIKFNQGYGPDTWYVRTHRFYPTHNGIDISSSSLNVKAVKQGTLFSGSYSGYNGCILPYVRVRHDEDGLDTFYLHVYSN